VHVAFKFDDRQKVFWEGSLLAKLDLAEDSASGFIDTRTAKFL